MIIRCTIGLLNLLPIIAFGQTTKIHVSKSSSNDSKVCISNFNEDDLTVDVKDLISDPLIKICDQESAQLISYTLVLNVNGSLSEWASLSNDSLNQTQLRMLSEVNTRRPNAYNQLFIENVKYETSEGDIKSAQKTYLSLVNRR